MKKVIFFLFSVSIITLINKEPQVIIPKDSIRFRIIANSNDTQDQLTKMQIRTDILPVLDKVSSSNAISAVRKNIRQNIPNIEKIVGNYTNNYKVSFGNNYFPSKTYKKVNYPEGDYESLVITLGNGIGDNWWCVLFPPLCLLEADKTNIQEVKYDFYVREIIKKYT